MLEWNKAKVSNLTGAEIWLMIVGRVLAGFGLGVLAVHYFPQAANPLGIPALLLGLMLVVVAAKGMFRPTKGTPD
jgi:hypothetical protein